MEGKKASPAKKIKLSSDAVDGINIKVNRRTANPLHKEVIDQPKVETLTKKDLSDEALNDPGIDQAVDDIAVSESNELLAVEDTYKEESSGPPKSKLDKLKQLLKNKWFYVGLGAVIIILLGVPLTRYFILGQFLTKNYEFTVIDSVTDKPVSGAVVVIGSKKASTNAYGLATISAYLGKRSYQITKQYYALDEGTVFVGFSKAKDDHVSLKATGRQIPITILNKLTNQPISGAKISVLNTNATTNAAGKTQIVLPTKKPIYQAVISGSGFNNLTYPINVANAITATTIKLVPSGQIYYLSNATGTINVMKANLDGSNPTAELVGTGTETSQTTLLTSPDNNYLVLEADRVSGQPGLYVINTSSGSLTEFDSSAASVNLIGWSGDLFVYDTTNSADATSTDGREQLKSYNALNGQLNVLDEDQVVGSSPTYGYQTFSGFTLLPNQVVYTTTWTSVNSYDLTSSNDTIRSVTPSGLSQKDYSTYPATTTSSMDIVRYQPASLYLSVLDSSTNQTSYFSFSNSSLSSTSISPSTFSETYPTYYLSPNSNEYLWTTNQSGTNETYTTNSAGQDQKRISLPNTYTAYGWYNNQYILLSRSGSLYIAPVSGSNSPQFVAKYFS